MPNPELTALQTALTGAEEVLRHDQKALVQAHQNVVGSTKRRDAAAQALHDYELKNKHV